MFLRAVLRRRPLSQMREYGGRITASTGGLYEKARKQYSLQDGMRLFHYSFFQKRRADAQVRWKASAP